jgi:hypothetical protein
LRGDRSNIAESLDYSGPVAQFHFQDVRRAFDEVNDTASG